MNTLNQWLAQATEQLRRAASSDSPELDAQLLACHGLSFTRAKIYAHPEHRLDERATSAFTTLLQRRLDGEPMAYITGFREFWSIPLMVNAGTLVPRADTELLVEKAIELAVTAPPGFILDLGTGSGAIAIALAQELNTRDILAIERSPEALDVAQANCRAHSTGNMHLLKACWLDSIADDVAAMVLTNPPYLAIDDTHLESLEYEPPQALVSGPSGLEDIAHIVAQTVRAGKSGAPLIIEHGYQQGAAVRQLLQEHQYRSIDTQRDLAGHERISFGLVSKTII